MPKRPMATVKNVKKAIFLIREISAEEAVRKLAGVRTGELIDRDTASNFRDSIPNELRVVFIEGLPAVCPSVSGIGITSPLIDKEDTRAIIAGASRGKD